MSSSQERIYLDAKGNEINLKNYKNKESQSSRWDSIDRNGIRYSILKPQYLSGLTDYKTIKEKIEKITSKKISDSITIIIEYYFKDDLCSSTRDNKWTRGEIYSRKSFLKPIKKKINKTGIAYFCLFEKGITLKNNPNKKNEFFFLDENNYFKDKLFPFSALCGSFAAIKPNGETLVTNGEYRADNFAQYLKTENWSLFFSPNQESVKH